MTAPLRASTAVAAIPNRGSGSPYARGDADRYYGRCPRPEKWLDPLGRVRVPLTDPEEVEEYLLGYRENPSDEKEW
ncbi:hypothetical protein [Rhodovulum sp. MB263]|uniref:hypothetical protein n=1 Tax=Rhodovulum sp. (strain MB263) TaxID=308754 RepID=UPI0009B72FB0|nr:hypothetical protein [Rhodovulum sp. MB263]ARC87857.1 hypothetical protein B5V46_04105 [Rhodovulum sp. MB263]